MSGWFSDALRSSGNKEAQELVAAADKKAAKQEKKQQPVKNESIDSVFTAKVNDAVLSIRTMLGTYTNVTSAEIEILAEKSVSQGWKYYRLKNEVDRVKKTADKRAMAESMKERGKAIAAIESRTPETDSARLRKIAQPESTTVGWTQSQIMGMLSTPSCRKVADKLGYLKDRDGSVTEYLTWRLGIKYEYGKEARSSDDIKTLRLAANEVLKLKK